MATQLDSGPPASARPTGTVTFLFSDIEGSTVRWERDREAIAAREGLRWARQAQDAFGVATALQHVALLLALRAEVNVAARLIGYVNVQYHELGYEREATEKWGYEKLVAVLREQLSEAAIEKLAAEGAAWSEDRAVEEALKV